MPRQNRVTPFGEIMATPERGTVLGNRGVLHDSEGRVKRAWQAGQTQTQLRRKQGFGEKARQNQSHGAAKLYW